MTYQITSLKDTKIRLFADDAFVYREITAEGDSATLQKDMDALTKWSNDWQMTFNTGKCFAMQFTTKVSEDFTIYLMWETSGVY